MSEREREQPVEEMTVEFVGGPLDGTRITDLRLVRRGPTQITVVEWDYERPRTPKLASEIERIGGVGRRIRAVGSGG